DDLAPGKPNEHVGAQDSVGALQRGLLEEVAVRDHADHLDGVAQLALPPRATCRRALERGYEVAGLLAQGTHAFSEVADHLRELALRLAALALEAPDLSLHPAEFVLHRSDEPLDLLAALGHLAGGTLLLGAALVLQAPRERLAGLREDVYRDRLQLVAHALPVVLVLGERVPRHHASNGERAECADHGG